MSSIKIYFIAGMAILFTSTLSLGGSLNTTISLDSIGGDDNIPVPASDADVTQITWFESDNNITSATVVVKNTDSGSHTYEICVITKAGASFSDTAGTSADCASTGSISASATGSAVINFANPLAATDVDDTDISIEQTA